jgi:hypothetical protein
MNCRHWVNVKIGRINMSIFLSTLFDSAGVYLDQNVHESCTYRLIATLLGGFESSIANLVIVSVTCTVGVDSFLLLDIDLVVRQD